MAVHIKIDSFAKMNKSEACVCIYFNFKHYEIINNSYYTTFLKADEHKPPRQEANTAVFLPPSYLPDVPTSSLLCQKQSFGKKIVAYCSFQAAYNYICLPK